MTVRHVTLREGVVVPAGAKDWIGLRPGDLQGRAFHAITQSWNSRPEAKTSLSDSAM